MALYRSGAGSPSVVVLPGAGLVGLDFLNVHEWAAEATTSVLYDRAGTGWSDPVELPRTAAEVVDELRELLDVAAVPGPYLLVGHSLGGLYARRFAQRHPDATAGLLLLDPGHEDLYDFLPAVAVELSRQLVASADLPELTDEQIAAARTAYAGLLARWPEPTRTELIDHHLTHWRTAIAESSNLDPEVHDELRAGGPVPDVPITVLTAGAGNPAWAQAGDQELIARVLAGIRELHAKLAGTGVHRVLDGATHQYPHLDRPDEVRAALADLLRRI